MGLNCTMWLWCSWCCGRCCLFVTSAGHRATGVKGPHLHLQIEGCQVLLHFALGIVQCTPAVRHHTMGKQY